ncbi:MAG TPA: amidohydrolase family protein, partial [Blastocatellia bacterium]|nr:amidohydrolase family protein [Blastocatellia bacterium]
QFGLPVMWTNARERGVTLHNLTRWMSQRPAELAGLSHCKGELKVGYDGDLVIWNPERSFVVEPAIIQHKHKLTPYNGRTLYGVVEAVYVRGQQVYKQGEFSAKPQGQLILK